MVPRVRTDRWRAAEGVSCVQSFGWSGGVTVVHGRTRP